MNVVPMAYMLMRNKNKSSLEEDNFTQNLKLSLQFSTTVFIIQSKITRLKKKGGGVSQRCGDRETGLNWKEKGKVDNRSRPSGDPKVNLSDTNCKRTVLKMLMKWKDRWWLWHQMDIFELKNITTEIKNSIACLTSDWIQLKPEFVNRK